MSSLATRQLFIFNIASLLICLNLVIAFPSPTFAQSKTDLADLELPIPATPSANEPLLKKISREKASEFLDRAAHVWQKEYSCSSCHSSYLVLMAQTAAKPPTDEFSEATLALRKGLESRIDGWDRGGPGAGLPEGTEGVSEVVSTAATLAFCDNLQSGKLTAPAKKALKKMWTLQQPNGAWTWNLHELPPQEYDDYFGAVFAAVGIAHAPENYSQSDEAKPGVAKLVAYFKKNPAPNLHHRLWLLWASTKLDGLLNETAQKKIIEETLALQRPDGGWNLPSLGDWQRLDGQENDRDAASDGYATGLAIYTLQKSCLPTNHPAITRGIAWLKNHQRESGRWYTRSVNADREHYISNAGSALALMAIAISQE